MLERTSALLSSKYRLKSEGNMADVNGGHIDILDLDVAFQDVSFRTEAAHVSSIVSPSLFSTRLMRHWPPALAWSWLQTSWHVIFALALVTIRDT